MSSKAVDFGIEEARHRSHVRAERSRRRAVDPCISVGLQAIRPETENGIRPIDKGDEFVVRSAALIDPVGVFVRRDALPRHRLDRCNVHDGEFLVAAEVVADVSVVDLGSAERRCARIANQQGDGDGVAAAGPEDLAAFLSALLATGPLIAAEIEDVDVMELVGEGVADAVGGVAVDPSAIGDEADDPTVRRFSYPVARPPERTHVGVVERVLQRRRRPSCVGVADRLVEGGIRKVGVVVVLAGLADGVGRVADDDADVEVLLAVGSCVVAGEEDGVHRVVFFGHLERVGEHDAGERLVELELRAGIGHRTPECGLDVDRRDVVRQQHDLVRMEFLMELAGQRIRLDETRLDHSSDERSGARERVEHVHALVRQ